MKLFISACLLGGLASCTTPGWDASPMRAPWESLPSPDKATISALAVGPAGRIYAGSGAGLHVSDDHGDSWSVTTSADWVVSSVLATTDSTILVGTYRRGVWRSADGGSTWTSVGFAGNVYVDALAKDANGHLFAAVAHSVDNEPTGLFRSDDDGTTWVPAGLVGKHAHSITIIADGSMYAGTSSGTFRSSDGRSSWTPAGGLPVSVPLSAIVRSGDALIAGFAEPRHRAPGAGAWVSTDDGQSWTQMTGLPPQTAVHSLWASGDHVLAATGNVVGGGGTGIHRLNSAWRWEPLALGGQWLRPLVATSGGQLLAGAVESGAFAGSPAGDHWLPRRTGMRNWHPTALAHDKEGRLYALSSRSLLRYERGASDWHEIALPKDAAAPTPFSFETLADGTLVMSGEGAVLLQSAGSTGWQSKDVPDARGPAISIHVSSDDRIFAIFPGQGVFESGDRGDSWVSIGAPLGTRGVCMAPSGAMLAFGAGVHRRADSGDWISAGLDEAMVFAVIEGEGELYLGSAPAGVFASQDDGRSWTPLMNELRQNSQQPGYIAVHSLLYVPGGGIVAATFSDGVHLLTRRDGWVDLSPGLPTRSMGDLALGSDGSVYVTTSVGVHRAELPRR